ncbi:UDP-N-acetylglucosamine 2-epimerase [uncultured Christiangramia sp.]|uniref:UDP-N-acetylglucosamine 2-epimerase n=1 Tax=uncultured Christiangramia sp. TaxID=503836 RepID=UPI0026038FFA|nr:UDP-N-acetylglucosamine 2-epimerase [uncultured Christiangramia sp.]
MKKRKIIAVSGARSDYDLLFSVYNKLDKDPEIEFKIVITGPNLSDNYGYTGGNIEEDGFQIAGKIFNLVDSSQKIGRIISIGLQIPSLANLLNQEKPDIVIVAGDREESITVTMSCAYLDIPVAHFFGGDIAKDGNIDNSVRYAASKFAHIHFPTLEEHKKTLLKLGEDDWRIHVIGNPALDRIKEIPLLSKDKIFSNLNVEAKQISNYSVLIQHPIITQVEQQSNHIKITLEALLNADGHYFINFPNSDAGSHEIIKAYRSYAENHPEKFTLFQNINRVDYINLLRSADFLIGNSSSGIVEVASLGLAAINVGERQKGRLHGDNVIFVDNNIEEILNAIDRVRNDHHFRSKVKLKINPYGDGSSADKAVAVLKKIDLNSDLIYKNITY